MLTCFRLSAEVGRPAGRRRLRPVDPQTDEPEGKPGAQR